MEMAEETGRGREGGGEIRNLGESAGCILRGAPNNPAAPLWPTIDGPLGLSEEDSLSYARSFFKFGFLLLPWLWAVNCFYFWPVLRHSPSFPRIRRYVFGSAVGFLLLTVLLSSWALTFVIGGERLFGPVWERLVMYNVADRFGLTSWS
ncbi:Gamma-secretase aspartyl protease complex [Macleaya cordata]|uniref:Gamma-secretase aspartyl protease complex n=1 Tax=Macleaya cordata TaxID=56857 RepID=A0A200Q5B0_MACCD|nr:Gamma-secretase aspartyl protease complex [Macleaya cordata]